LECRRTNNAEKLGSVSQIAIEAVTVASKSANVLMNRLSKSFKMSSLALYQAAGKCAGD
jgi:hypothetical protein